MTSQTDVIYRNQYHYKEFVLKVCKEKLLTVNIVMYFPKNFFMREAINRKLSELEASGLLEQLTQSYADPRFINIKATQSTGPQRLNVHHLFGVINIWAIGLAISLLIFVLEIFIQTLKRALKLKFGS